MNERDVLLIDAEHNEVSVMAREQARMYYQYSAKAMVYRNSRLYRHEYEYSPGSNGSGLSIGGAAPRDVMLPYGLWEHAEARHKGETPVVGIRTPEERRMVRDILWARRELIKAHHAIYYGRGADA